MLITPDHLHVYLFLITSVPIMRQDINKNFFFNIFKKDKIIKEIVKTVNFSPLNLNLKFT